MNAVDIGASPVDVTIVIIAYEAAAQLPRCLAAVTALEPPPRRIIVIDNASTDGSAEIAENFGARVVRANVNLGFAAANNLAARQSDTEWLAFLNPDAYPQADWIAALLAATTRWPDADAFGSTQLDASDPTLLDGIGDGYFFAGVPYRAGFGKPLKAGLPEGEVFGPCAAAALWRRERFLALGGFEERFFCYGEDVDLAYRHRLAGGICVQVPGAVVHHEGSGISGRRSDFTTYHGHRNRVWTYLRDTPSGLLALSLPLHIALNLYLLLRLALAGQARPYIRAMRDAARGMGPFWRERWRLHDQKMPRGLVGILTWSPIALAARRAKIRTRQDDR